MTDDTLSRREAIAAAAAAAAALAAQTAPARAVAAATAQQAAHRFLTRAEFALVDELSDIIIPTDDHSPGARAALVAAYIDGRLAESPADQQAAWRSGLQAVDALARELNGKPFLQGTPEQRVAVVTRMAAGEGDPKTPAERFFGRIKGWTIRGYYTSKIGIIDDQQYKGNVIQPGDYAGYDAT
jgi:Gluconate 2-dehydrogenase subunit 3